MVAVFACKWSNKMWLSLRGKKYIFNIHPFFLLLCIASIILFSIMSAWQFYRYHFKKTLVSTYDIRLKNVATTFRTYSEF